MTRSTARQGAVRITDKHGRVWKEGPVGPSIPLARIAWMVKTGRETLSHEHDFSPLYDGSRVLVCACGAVRNPDGEEF